MSITSNGQPLVLPQIETKRRINGQYRHDFNDPVHRTFNHLRSRLAVTDNYVSETTQVETIDCDTLKNTTNEGIRVVDERITSDRLPVDQRELVIAMTASTQPSVSSLTGFIRFDTVRTPAFGITQQWLDNEISTEGHVEKIPIHKTGIYDVVVRITLAPYGGSDPNCFQQVYLIRTDQLSASQTALSDVLGVRSVVRKTSDAGANLLIEGSSVLRYDVQVDDDGQPILDGNGNPTREATSHDLSIFYSRNKTSHPIVVQSAEMRVKLLVADE